MIKKFEITDLFGINNNKRIDQNIPSYDKKDRW